MKIKKESTQVSAISSLANQPHVIVKKPKDEDIKVLTQKVINTISGVRENED